MTNEQSKHDGKLDGYPMITVSRKDDLKWVRIDDHEQEISTFLDASQALSLLTWLQQESLLLEQWAKEDEA